MPHAILRCKITRTPQITSNNQATEMSSFSKCCFATKLLHKVPKLPATNQLDQSGLEGSTISMCFIVLPCLKRLLRFLIYFLVFILSTSVYWVMVCQLNLLWHLTRQVSEKWRWHCPPLAACKEMQCCQKDPSERQRLPSEPCLASRRPGSGLE